MGIFDFFKTNKVEDKELLEHDVCPKCWSAKEYQDQFKSILADGIADGIWHPISTTTALNLIVNAVRWLHYYNNRLSEDDFVGMKNEIKSFIRRGLKCA